MDRRVGVSANQVRYVTSELAGAGSYMITMGHLVEGSFDEPAFRAAAEELVRRHDTLRTRFELKGGRIDALISPEPRFRYHVRQMTDPGLLAFRDWALPLVFDDVDPCSAGSLIRVLAADMGPRWRFTIAAHHAITDGYSRGVMTQELLKLYVGEALEPAQSYYAFYKPEAEVSAVSDEVAAHVHALPKPVRLMGDGAEDGTAPSLGQFVDRDFGPLFKVLRPVSGSVGASRFGILSGVYALGLYGYSGDPDISTFFQAAGRKSLGAPNAVVGPFSNTLPLDLAVDPDRDFASFARTITLRTRAMVALENAPLLTAVLEAQKGPSVSINMFPPAEPIIAGRLVIGPREFLDRRTEFELNLVWSEDDGIATARAFHDRARMSAERAGLFLDFQSRLLDAVIEDPERPCREILRAARAGHEVVIPHISLDPEPQHRLHERFFHWADRTPEATALTTSDGVVSYRGLAERVRRVMGGLHRAGVGPGDRVAILSQRDPGLVAAMLGVSASGASFAVIDAAYPARRIKWMLDQLGTRYVIETGAYLPKEYSGVLIRIETDDRAKDDMPVVFGPPRDAAYHLFTSGTTGRPKLITHPDRTLQRFIHWQDRMLDLSEPVRTVMIAGLSHDPILRDVFLPLSCGGSVAIPTAAEVGDPEALRRLMVRARCNVAHFSPATGRLLSMGAAADHRFDHLRAVFWGGERLPHRLMEAWCAHAPTARQFNVFGTTETPQAFLIHEIKPAAVRRREIPIGRPLPWQGVQLMDHEGHPVSTGEVGEILAELADPVLGVNARLPAPDGRQGHRHFTGDLGYQMPDGQIHFAGRRDGQVKINGYRVELGEVEAVAEGADGVQQASAILEDDHLMLFVLTRDPGVTETTIKALLSRTLPAYMIPEQIMVLDRFPATPNGKTDKDALAARASEARTARGRRDDSAPEGPVEQAIAALLARHAGRSRAGRDTSLADLGADSLATIEARLDLEALGLTLPDGWEWMSVAQLAEGQTGVETPGRPGQAFLSMSRIETFIPLRSLAILAIVAFHAGINLGIGASLVLFVLAGYSFARLQLPAILRDDHPGRVWALILRLLVPLLPISLIYFAKHAIVDDEVQLSTILPYKNLVVPFDALLSPGATVTLRLELLWFLHVYLQMFLVIGLLLSIPALRRLLAADVWRGLVLFLIATEAVGVLAILLYAQWHGDLWESAFLLRQSPTTMLPFLAVGALVAMADTPRRLALSLALVLCHWGVSYLFYNTHAELWWAAALILCALVPNVTLPRVLAVVLVIVASHSLMIYLTHHAAAFAILGVFGDRVPTLLSIVLQVGFGVAAGIAIRPAVRWLGVNRLAEHGLVGLSSRLRSNKVG